MLTKADPAAPDSIYFHKVACLIDWSGVGARGSRLLTLHIEVAEVLEVLH